MSEHIDHPEFWSALRRLYVPVRILGRGGMATVTLARERGLERLVALKRLEHPASEDDRERFRREARILAALRHPCILAIHALGDAADTPYMALEYINGESLAARVTREGRLPGGTVTRLLSRLADALAVVHRAGVIHRDLKPDNVLVDPEGMRPVLTDFGVATVASSDHSRSEIQKAQGTPAYMAPEQILGDQEVTGRCDIYSLGVMGYQLLSGRLPFEGTSHGMAAQHVSQAPTPLESIVPDVAPALARVIHRCLEKAPGRRWADADAVREALDTVAMGAPSAASSRDAGFLDLILLRIVAHGPAHGFELTQRLRAAADGSVPFEEGELYAALHRMQAAGFLHVEWGAAPTGRRTRFYRLSGRGHRRLQHDGERFLAQAEAIVRVMRRSGAGVA